MTTKKTITLAEATTIMNDPSKSQVMLNCALLRAGYRVMHYYGQRILASEAQISDFCIEGLDWTDGCQRDRLLELLVQLDNGRFHIYDQPLDGHEDAFDRDEPIMTWEAWQLD